MINREKSFIAFLKLETPTVKMFWFKEINLPGMKRSPSSSII
jgi:hypothetical protein